MFADIIHKIAGQWQEEDHVYYPRPSMAGPDRCIRQMVYHGLGIKKEPLPGRTLLIFDDGNWHEELTFNWLRKSIYKIHSEQMEVECPAPMKKGNIDCIATDEINQLDWLVEHKGINHFTFQKYWDGALPNDYFAQTMIYFEALKKVANPTGAVLLIKNKNTSAYLEYLIKHNHVVSRTNSNGDTITMDVDLSDSVFHSVIKFEQVNAFIKEKMLPKRQYFIGDDWQCDYCGWGKLCWGDYKKEFTELKTDTMLPDDVADMLRYYKELGGQKSDIEKEYKELSGKIKDTMKQIGAREGRAGEFIAKLSLTETNRIDKEKLSAEAILAATVTSMSERLYVSTPKIKEATNG
jgi:hypothetical protein